MKWAATHLAIRKKLCQAVEKKKCLKVERGWRKEVISNEYIVLGKVTFLRGMGRIYWEGYLTR